MATALFGTLDPTDLIFTYASAGHPQPVIITDGHKARVLESHGGLPLGACGVGSPPATTVALNPGALLVLYTDGLTELKRNIPEGEATLCEASAAEHHLQSRDPAKSIMDRVLAGRQPRDDIAIVTLSVSAAPLERFSLTLPAEPSSVREARYAFRKLAKTLGIEPNHSDLFEIALGEAVNNAIEHAYGAEIGTVHVRAWREGADLIVEIEDHGQWRKERAEGRGYGLPIMRVFASSVDIRREVSGTIVRLSHSLGPSTPTVTSERSLGGAAPAVAPDTGAAHAPEMVPASPEGRFRVDHTDGAPVVKIAGDIDLVNADDFCASLESAARTDKRTVIADLTEVSFLDSKAVAVLLNFYARLSTNRQRLTIVLPHDNVARRVLHLAGVEEIIPIFRCLSEAVADVKLGNNTIK
jgi:anti-anti-sigma factor